MKRIIFATTSLLALLTATQADAQTTQRGRLTGSVPFAKFAAFGQEVEVLRHGSISLLFTCNEGIEEFASDVARLRVVSSVADMLITSEEVNDHGDYKIATRPADQGVAIELYAQSNFQIFGELAKQPGYILAQRKFLGAVSSFSMITPAGYWMNVAQDAIAFGFRLSEVGDLFPSERDGWANAADCLVTGYVNVAKFVMP